MIEVYKILHTIYDNEVSPKLAIYNERVTRIRNRGHLKGIGTSQGPYA